MLADRKWVERNLGIDPIEEPTPLSTFYYVNGAGSKQPEDIQREIIDFDSESTEGMQFFARSKATGLTRYVDVPFPEGLAPATARTAGGNRLTN